MTRLRPLQVSLFSPSSVPMEPMEDSFLSPPGKLKPLRWITCSLISVGLLLPLLVAVPEVKPIRKEIIGLSCVMLFVGTLARMRLERCRMELLQTSSKKREVKRRLWASVLFEELETSALEFRCMHIQVMPEGVEVGGKTAHVDVVEKASVLESGLSSATQKTCLCCLEDFQPSSQVAVLPCGHIFDEDCILAWSAAKRKASRTCPTCRSNFTVL